VDRHALHGRPRTAVKLVALLLAAGRGTRYDPRGDVLKLLVPAVRGAHAGAPLATAAARTLRAAVGDVVAVVRAADSAPQRELHALLRDEGCALQVCDRADEGMGASIACGVTGSAQADGWLIALADMPAISVATVQAIAKALADGAVTAAPAFQGQRGHPVGFAAALRAELAALEGDDGARAVLAAHPPRLIDVDDAGVLYDVDTPAAARS